MSQQTSPERATLAPDGPIIVVDPPDWGTDAVERLERQACDGATVVFVGEVKGDAWSDLVGVDPTGASTPVTELVIDAADHPAARNLGDPVTITGRSTAVSVRQGTTPVLTTSVHMADRPLVTVRPLGAGQVIGVHGIGLYGAGQKDAPPVASVVRRLVYPSPSTTPAGIGILGYGQHGGMGWLHATASERVEGLRLAAVCELAPARLADARQRFVDATMYDDTDAFFADPAVDVVIVATPPSTHYALTLQALRAGKHVVVEKPLCFTATEADELLAVAAEVGRTLTVHQNRRWDADYLAISALIAQGRLGEVFNVETFVGGFEHPCRLWHSDRGISGGRLYDWGAHLIDQTLRLVGHRLPTEVSAVGHKNVWHDVTNLDQVRVRMRFDDGLEAEFLDSDVLAVRRPKYVVQGTKGTLVGHYEPVVHEDVSADHGYERTEFHHAEGPARLTLVTHHTDWGLQETTVPGLAPAPFPFHRALADHLQLGDPVPVDAVEIRDVTAVLEAAMASALDGGRTIRLEPSKAIEPS